MKTCWQPSGNHQKVWSQQIWRCEQPANALSQNGTGSVFEIVRFRGGKRTFLKHSLMSAFDPKRTSPLFARIAPTDSSDDPATNLCPGLRFLQPAHTVS